MSYRPITDVWILARSKTKYYGAFPAGFLSRARALLGVGPEGIVLHVCAGMVRDYPFKGFGPFDLTVDIDPATEPDFCLDVRTQLRETFSDTQLDAVLIDRPYSEEDADHYATGRATLPDLNQLLRDSLALVPIGHRVGVIDYRWPMPPKNATEVAVVAVGTGRNGRARWYTVFERIA